MFTESPLFCLGRKGKEGREGRREKGREGGRKEGRKGRADKFVCLVWQGKRFLGINYRRNLSCFSREGHEGQ